MVSVNGMKDGMADDHRRPIKGTRQAGGGTSFGQFSTFENDISRQRSTILALP